MSQAQAWHHAKQTASFAAHKGMATALRQSPGKGYELAPFAPMQHDGAWWIGCNTDPDGDEGEILLIGGLDGSMRYIDGGNGFYGATPQYDQPLHLYTGGIAFARAWAANRAAVYALGDAIATHRLTSTDSANHCPGLAVVGDLAACTSLAALAGAPSIVIDDARARGVLADALLRAARVPAVTVMQAALRVAA